MQQHYRHQTNGNFKEIDMIVFFKRLGSRHIHKEMKIQNGTKGVVNILCKTDLYSYIQRLACKYKTFNFVQFETFLSSPMYHCGIHNFNDNVLRNVGDFFLCDDVGLN